MARTLFTELLCTITDVVTLMTAWISATNIVSPLGLTSNENFLAVRQGRSGLAPHNVEFAPEPLWVSAIDTNWLSEAFEDIANPAQYSRLEQMSILSISDALRRSGLSITERTGFVYCTTKGNIDALQSVMASQSATTLPLHELANKVAQFIGMTTTPVVVSNACVSGLQGLIVAHRLLDLDLYDDVIVTGGDMLSKFTLTGFKSFNALSRTVCRPFDADRDGINLGEAAATIILSRNRSTDQAVTLKGGYVTNDATHLSAPSRTGDGLTQAIQRLHLPLADQIGVDFVSAHGTATRYNDDMEAHAFFRTGLSTRPVHSLKGYFGHTLGAAGLLESIIVVKSLEENTLIASKGFTRTGTTYPLPIVTQTVKQPLRCALKTSSGFGGGNAAALFLKNV